MTNLGQTSTINTMEKSELVAKVKEAINLTKQKDFNSAGKIYVELLKHDKKNPTILSLLGLLYLNIGKINGAKKLLTKANKLNPNNPTTIEALGFVMYNLCEFQKACTFFESIIEQSKNYEVYEKFINSLIELKFYSKAYKISEKAIKMFPLNKEILSSMVYVCIYTGRLQEAVKYSQQLMSTYPKHSKSWLRQGLVQEVIFHDDKSAKDCYKMALKYGEKTSAYYNLAISCNKTKDYKKAEYYIKKVIKIEGLNSNNYFILATACFGQKKLKLGYKYYSIKDSMQSKDPTISKLKNIWDGKSYKDETLFVYCDQGIGDSLMFSRYFPFLNSKFKKVIISGYPYLKELFKRSFKDYKNLKFRVHTKTLPKYDKAVVMSNLPYTLKKELDFPFADGYLVPDKKIVQNFKEKYFNTDKLKVGICWEAGAAGIREQLNRTLHISVLDEILKMDGIQFYSLQYKPILDDYKNYKNIIDLSPEFKDFDDTAGAIQNLDVVVTVDTSIAHLAGALGAKTFMLLPYCPDWRWFNDDKTTDWYKSMRIFKQVDSIFWDKEIHDIKTELEKMLLK